MTGANPLVERILRGDRDAFQLLIQQHQRLVSHIVFRLVPDGHDREDLCQEVFLKAYRGLASFRADSSLSTWIAQIAYNACLNFLKQRKLVRIEDLSLGEQLDINLADPELRPDEQAEGQDLAERLRGEISKLPVPYRTILTLYHLDEFSYAEIGKVLKLPEGTVKSHLFRARNLLKSRLLTKYKPEDLWK